MTKKEEIEWWTEQGEKSYSMMLEISWGEIIDLLNEYYIKGLEVGKSDSIDEYMYVEEEFEVLFNETSIRLNELLKNKDDVK